jgi:hypothetical protein
MTKEELYLKGEFIDKGFEKEVFLVIGHPDKVMKFGESVINEANKFNKNPQFTPKVYHIDHKKKFTVIEKLNVDDAKQDFENHIRGLKSIYSIKDFKFDNKFEKLKNKVKSNEGLEFLNKIREIVLQTKMGDINPKNFGYDKNGVLKCIDL